MISFDWWNSSNDAMDVTNISMSFYPNDGEYRGNFYKGSKVIGDFVSNDSVELQETFKRLFNIDIFS